MRKFWEVVDDLPEGCLVTPVLLTLLVVVSVLLALTD